MSDVGCEPEVPAHSQSDAIDPKPTSDQRNCLDWQQARLGFQRRSGPLNVWAERWLSPIS